MNFIAVIDEKDYEGGCFPAIRNARDLSIMEFRIPSGKLPDSPSELIEIYLQRALLRQKCPPMEADFRQLFCEATGCAVADFENVMFSKCLFRHAFPFTWFIRNKRDFFREDLDMLRDIASAHNTPEVISELNRFYGRNKRDKSFLRTRLFVRISGKRVLRLYRRLVADHAPSSSLGTLQAQS